MYQLVEDMSEMYAHPLPRVYAIVLFAIEYSAKAQHTTTGARGRGGATPGRAPLLLCVEPWLNTQWQTEKLHILLAKDGHIFLTCPKLVGRWMKNILGNLVPIVWRVMFQISRVMACQYPACQ